MPLSPEERRFLDAYVYEATHGPPFGGPATRGLAQMGIGYAHLSWILTAYQRELSKERTPASGIHNVDPPPSPWNSLHEVQQRAQVLRHELDCATSEPQTVHTQ
jgi:hypothetical protein